MGQRQRKAGETWEVWKPIVRPLCDQISSRTKLLPPWSLEWWPIEHSKEWSTTQIFLHRVNMVSKGTPFCNVSLTLFLAFFKVLYYFIHLFFMHICMISCIVISFICLLFIYWFCLRSYVGYWWEFVVVESGVLVCSLMIEHTSPSWSQLLPTYFD